MSPPTPSLLNEFKALALGQWQLLKQEMAGKANLTKSQLILMAAGLLTALTAILLTLAGITLLLSQLLVSQARWEPLIAGGISALIIATLFGLTGFLVFRSGGSALSKEGLAPRQTIHSLKSIAQSLTNQPITPNLPINPMKTRQEFQEAIHDTAQTVNQQARRATRAVADSVSSAASHLDTGSLLATALAWVDALMTPQNRALASRTLKSASSFPRRHPAASAALGLGGLYLLWQKSRGTDARDTVEQYAADRADEVRQYANQGRRYAAEGLSSAFAAGRDIRDTLTSTANRLSKNGRQAASRFSDAATATAEGASDTYDYARESFADGAERVAEAARQLRDDAEIGLKKAREFAKEEPAIAIAGGVAIALGALLLLKSSRR